MKVIDHLFYIRIKKVKIISQYNYESVDSFKQYKEKVNELYGEDASERVEKEIIKDNSQRFKELASEGELLFFDYRTMHYFNSTVDKVLDKIVTDDGLECFVITTPFDNDFPINYMF